MDGNLKKAGQCFQVLTPFLQKSPKKLSWLMLRGEIKFCLLSSSYLSWGILYIGKGNRVPKCDVIKNLICEIMGFVRIF